MARSGPPPDPPRARSRGRGQGRNRGRGRGWEAPAFTVAALIVMGASFSWSPWREQAQASRPPGVEVRDCDLAEVSVVQFSARLRQLRDGSPGGVSLQSPTAAVSSLSDVVLRTRAVGAVAVQQVGRDVAVVMAPCEAVAVEVGLSVPRTAAGEEDQPVVGVAMQAEPQRLHAGDASLYLSAPSQVPCQGGGACGTWTGWYVTLESAGSGETRFSVPVRWGGRSRVAAGAGGWGVLDVAVWVMGGERGGQQRPPNAAHAEAGRPAP